MSDIQEITLLLRSLFKSAFTQKCSIEDTLITSDEEKSIQNLTLINIIHHLQELLQDLIDFKKNILNSEVADILKQNDQIEKMLQKSEAEVRFHIRTENQLKIMIESNQIQIDELEKTNQKNLNEIKKLHEKFKTGTKSNNEKILADRTHYMEQCLKDKEKIIEKLEQEIISLRGINKSESDNYYSTKSRDKDNAHDDSRFLNKLKRFANEKPIRPIRDRSIRKSAFDGDFSKNLLVGKVSNRKVEKIHFRSTSENIRHKSAGRRAPSR